MKFSFNSYMFEQNKNYTDKNSDNKAFDEKLTLMIKKNKIENENNKSTSPFNINSSNNNNFKEENFDNEGDMNFIRSGCFYDENSQEKINEYIKEDKKIDNNKDDYFKRDYPDINDINSDIDMNNGTFGHKSINENNNKKSILSYNCQLKQNKNEKNNIYQDNVNMDFDNNNRIIDNNGTNRNIGNNKLYNYNNNTINDSYDIDSMIINKMNNLLSTRRSNNNTINQCLNIIDNEEKQYNNILYCKNNNAQNDAYNEQKNNNIFEKYNDKDKNNNITKKDEFIFENNNYNGNELKLNDLLKESNKNKEKLDSKYNKNQNFFDEDDYSESSLEQKIKKLQKKAYEQKDKEENEFKYYLENNEDSFIENSRMKSKNGNNISNSSSIKSSFNSDKKLNRFKYLKKCNKSKSSSKLIRINKNNRNSSSINKNKINVRNNSIRSKGNHKNHLSTEYNINYEYNIRKYQNEIIQLKNIINKLKIENEKLKKSLQEERKQNKKFKQLTEEIIKHYEKNKY